MGVDADEPIAIELIALERRGWEALATEGAAAAFFGEVLGDDVLFVLPGDLVLDDRDAVLRSMSGPPWSSFELSDERVLALAPNAAVVTYRAIAERDGATYRALLTSAYRRVGGRWQLVAHQQTPI
jgi:hypothetical protein